MASLKFLLGMIPATSKIEQEEKDLIAEFAKLNAFTTSDKLAEYNKLDKLVNSSDFIQKKKEIEGLQYKGSEEYSREKEFQTLQKSKDIVLYFRTAAGTSIKKFQELDGSEKIKDYETLEKEVTSVEFRQKMKSKEFRKSEDFSPASAKLQKYKELKSGSEIKDYYKFKSSKELANFKNIDGSKKLERFDELKEFVASDEFKKRKEYLLDKKRFEKNEMFSQLQEYEKLKKDPDIIWYFKVRDSNKFDVLKHRELTFSDEFEGEKLDTKKWLTNYFWGDKLLKDRYSLESDLQAFTEKENFELRNSTLKINIKPQKVTGKIWTADKGFSTKEFGFTSGIINSGTSFRQKYGIFSAKIKLGNANAKSAFWMLSDKITPHVNVCRTSAGKVAFEYFVDGKHRRTSVGSRYSNDFFIFTLEWTSDKLVWKVNNTEVFTQTEQVPQEPMYINLAATLDKPMDGMSSMEIDWVRVYQPVK